MFYGIYILKLTLLYEAIYKNLIEEVTIKNQLQRTRVYIHCTVYMYVLSNVIYNPVDPEIIHFIQRASNYFRQQ